MEEKKTPRKYNPVWSISRCWNNNIALFWKYNSQIRNEIILTKSQGFGFIQLIIAAGLLFVVGSFLITVFQPIARFQKSNDAIRKSDLNNVADAIANYYQKYHRYPDSSSNFKIMENRQSLEWGADAFVPYMAVLPQDPLSDQQYVYYSSDNNQAFWLYTALENTADPQACGKNCNFGNGDIPPSACSKSNQTIQCNYGVSSSNVTP